LRPEASPFSVRVAEIPPEGLRKTLDLTGAFLETALAGSDANAAESRAIAEVELTRTGHDVFARGQLAGDLTVVCSRCAGAARVALREPFQLVFVPRGHKDADLAAPEEPDDLDLVPFDGDTVDLGEPLREELLLAIPIAPLCSEACRGLCPRCGADLNEGPCGCPEEPGDDRFAALKNLKV
jgi:uncharacterized protein